MCFLLGVSWRVGRWLQKIQQRGAGDAGSIRPDVQITQLDDRVARKHNRRMQEMTQGSNDDISNDDDGDDDDDDDDHVEEVDVLVSELRQEPGPVQTCL